MTFCKSDRGYCFRFERRDLSSVNFALNTMTKRTFNTIGTRLMSFAIRVNGGCLWDYVGINQPVTIVGKVLTIGDSDSRGLTEMVLRSSDGVNILIEQIPVCVL
jgi:hypothetical protein